MFMRRRLMTGESAGYGPDFVCIGAQKAGTTWLYDNLVVQQSIWMPPEKEIHFFNTLCANEALLGVEEPQPLRRWDRYRPLLSEPSRETLRWIRRFHCGARSTRWYYSLFPESLVGGRLCGDITPAYSTLDQRGVDFARRVLKPGCRILLMVRNPVDRVWSAIKMLYRWRGDEPAAAEVEALIAQACEPTHRLRGDYARMVRLWGDAFGEDFRVFRYERLAAEPAELLRDVGEFLGVRLETTELDLAKRSNYDPDRKPMPAALRRALTDAYRAEIEELDTLLPGVAGDWLASTGAVPTT
jgi:hypothetical protein